jgi:hypothetical protein
MNFRNRETIFALFLILTLVVLTVLGAIGQDPDEAAIPLDSRSTAPEGARALFDWFEEIGYTVDDSVAAEYVIPEGTRLVFLLEPFGLVRAELDILVEWVENGGLLIAAGERFGTSPLLSTFDIERGYADEAAASTAPSFPLFIDPPVETTIPLGANSFFEPDFADFLPLAALPEGPVVITF